MLKKSHVGIARLRHPLNLGSRNEEVQFVIAVIAPKKEVFLVLLFQKGLFGRMQELSYN